MKPVALVSKTINNSSPRDGIVLDPFLGSGTTLIAAEQLGRKCYGIEIEPRYVDVILKRWMNLTGKSPIRESDGAALVIADGGLRIEKQRRKTSKRKRGV